MYHHIGVKFMCRHLVHCPSLGAIQKGREDNCSVYRENVGYLQESVQQNKYFFAVANCYFILTLSCWESWDDIGYYWLVNSIASHQSYGIEKQTSSTPIYKNNILTFFFCSFSYTKAFYFAKLKAVLKDKNVMVLIIVYKTYKKFFLPNFLCFTRNKLVVSN